jgi:hypothetical protein
MSSYETGRFTKIGRAELRTVASADDVAAVVERMRNDLHEHPGEWENHTLERFLDALAACLTAQRQLYTNMGEQYPATAEWRLFAEALVAATGYE